MLIEKIEEKEMPMKFHQVGIFSITLVHFFCEEEVKHANSTQVIETRDVSEVFAPLNLDL